MKQMLYAVVVLMAAGCGTSGTATTAPPTVTVTATPPATAAPQGTATPSTTAAQTTAAPSGEPAACTDDQLDVTNAPVESADTLRRVVVTFKNISSQECVLVGYPGVDLVTPAGGVLINVARRPANAAHHLKLSPGDKAVADVQSYAVDTKTGDACARYGTLVVTPPNGFRSRTLQVDLPICDATVSSVD
jgi:Protein of unknown function (DUF4232)